MPRETNKNWKRESGKYFFVFVVFAFLFFLNKAFPAQKISSLECSQGNCDFSLENPEDSDFSSPVLEQNEANFDFAQLENLDLFLGEIFQANSEHISAVELDFDVIKQHNNGGKEYTVALKEVKEKNGEWEIKSGELSEAKFQINELTKFRQKNGKYRFDFDADVKEGKYYFVGIDNSKMQVDRFNRLILKGSEADTFGDGFAATKKDRKTEILKGDLYFRIFE